MHIVKGGGEDLTGFHFKIVHTSFNFIKFAQLSRLKCRYLEEDLVKLN